MTRPIVVGMDLSEPSITALEEALTIARRRGAEIVLVHATPLPGSSAPYHWASPGIVERYQQMITEDLEQSRSALSELRERHLGQGVEISTTLVSGDAERAISETAKEIDAQLIVVGSHGRASLDRFILGSVAERVSRFTHRDVLVSRSQHPHGDYQRTLVATDFSETSKRAFDMALTLAAEGGAITLLHCVSVPPGVAGFSVSDIVASLEVASAEEAENMAERGRDHGLTVDVVISTGYPPTEIEKHAKGHDLVVIGSHGRRGFRRYLLGSVAEKTVRNAPCSVYIARASEPQATEGARS